MANYNSRWPGPQIDQAVGLALNPDTTPASGSTDLITSGGVFDAVQTASPAITETAAGALVHITDASAAPATSVVAEIVATQDGSGTPSPGNPRAINGFTGAKIRSAGKNLVYIPDGSGSNQSITFSCSGGVVTLTGIASGNAWRTISDDFILKAGTYRLSGGGQSNTYLSLRTAVGNSNIAGTGNGDVTFTLAADTAVHLRAYAANGTDLSGGKTYYPQIEVGSTTTAWEAFAGDIITVDWTADAGTVYGGTINVTTRILTVTHILTTFDGSADENWLFNTVDASRNRMSIALPSVKIPPSYSDDYIANWLGPSLASSPQVWLASYTNQGILRVGVPTTIASVSDWQTYLGNDPLDIVYPLATPITYQLTPAEVETLLGINTEVETLLGINNIWADTGDVSVEYRADTALFIEGKVPEAPTTDGTYTLTCTVSGGVATYSWA